MVVWCCGTHRNGGMHRGPAWFESTTSYTNHQHMVKDEFVGCVVVVVGAIDCAKFQDTHVSDARVVMMPMHEMAEQQLMVYMEAQG